MKIGIVTLLIILIATIQPARATNNFTSVAFGDSVTVGDGVTPAQSYIHLIGVATGTSIDNRAVGGSLTISQTLTIEQYQGNATDVIWLPGYNDFLQFVSPDVFGRALREGLDHLKSRTVYLGLTLRVAELGCTDYGNGTLDPFPRREGWLSRYYAAEIEVARNYSNVIVVPTLDYIPCGNVLSDWIHPKPSGHVQIANSFLRMMQPTVREYYFPFVGR